ncbi:hypothetical protein HMPREF9622_02753 [Cutibacterium modestum HL037PA3]|uniref:Uncharacterized protein n=1 Tax=Cutibacterium modestum HL044PA1 TaxID=765109 RepID=A0ABN0C4W5_9ACTN|nr:hypothetical protein HMPREF9621_02559 [Cutibacterium modestum HL037PA2]EFS92305.1 hypothetical protein HMPREF9607_01648 [Cutibacterium modestum HL044PA1]EFT14264.1 hypothetical protein HMPREF9622_02753 [Cutibacterium modestum HL037PA3]
MRRRYSRILTAHWGISDKPSAQFSLGLCQGRELGPGVNHNNT